DLAPGRQSLRGCEGKRIVPVLVPLKRRERGCPVQNIERGKSQQPQERDGGQRQPAFGDEIRESSALAGLAGVFAFAHRPFAAAATFAGGRDAASSFLDRLVENDAASTVLRSTRGHAMGKRWR